ncbi:MAG: TetR/AcrR family transcriptional regulator [Spirosomataceae bacterium]
MRLRDENKEKIVREKALELLVKEGVNGFSMQKLAKAAEVSPATLYIYYQDKDDLILKIANEEGQKMVEATFENFDPLMPFEDGLRVQWRNRSKYCLENPIATQFFEQLQHTPYREKMVVAISEEFKETMGKFITHAIKNQEIRPMPLEVFWSVAYAPLYNLIRFHQEGQSVGGRPFTWNEDYMEQTLLLVLKALKR